MILQANEISAVTAYVAGLVTFLAPCHLPLVPAFLSYVTGVTLQEAQAVTDQADLRRLRRLMFTTSLAYVAGFLVVFVAFGLTASYLGSVLHDFRQIMHIIGGLLLILVGAYIAGLFELRFLSFTKRIVVPKQMTRFAPLNAFLIGLAFGFSWTPCIGPVLAVILFWAGQSSEFWRGTTLLLLYGLGLGTPFLLLSLFIQQGTMFLRKYRTALHRITRLSGIFMMVIGVLLLGNWIYLISAGFTRFGSLELYLFDIR